MIGVIGLGTMGKEIAKKFSENNVIYVYNRTQSVAEKMDRENINITQCKSINEISSLVKVIFVCVSDYKALEMIISEINIHKSQIKVFINFSTILPQESEKLNQTLKQIGINYYDAPISGGPEAIVNESLGCIISGENKLDSYSLSFIEKITKNISFIQGIGQSQYIKIMNNLMETINMVSSMETIKFLRDNNFEFEEIRKLLSTMRGYSIYADVLLDRLENPRDEASVPIYIREKDLNLSRKLTENYKNMDLSNLANIIFKRYKEPLKNYDDQTDIYEVYRKKSFNEYN